MHGATIKIINGDALPKNRFFLVWVILFYFLFLFIIRYCGKYKHRMMVDKECYFTPSHKMFPSGSGPKLLPPKQEKILGVR